MLDALVDHWKAVAIGGIVLFMFYLSWIHPFVSSLMEYRQKKREVQTRLRAIAEQRQKELDDI